VTSFCEFDTKGAGHIRPPGRWRGASAARYAGSREPVSGATTYMVASASFAVTASMV
jgi:hypothetical protein